MFTGRDVEAAVRPPDVHFAQSRLVIIENTNNRGGGTVWPLETVAEVGRSGSAAWAARASRRCAPAERVHRHPALKPTAYTQHVDSVSMCFSKGLGAPVGSAVAGTKAFTARTHRFRKMFGGAMRQAGILAAAALYAIEHNVERLAEDHANARRLAEAIAELPGIRLDPRHVETNIVIFELGEELTPAAEVHPTSA